MTKKTDRREKKTIYILETIDVYETSFFHSEKQVFQSLEFLEKHLSFIKKNKRDNYNYLANGTKTEVRK